MSTSLYIHIPWCLQKCIYCDFNSSAITKSENIENYITALKNDLQQELSFFENRKINTVFIGGGTPTVLSTEQIKQLLDTIYSNINPNNDLEITIEANPETLDQTKLLAIKQGGINRISFGVQTFDDHKLQYLNRAHTSTKAIDIIKCAQDLELTNINIDLMFGLPEQSIQQMLDDIDMAANLNPTHISHYQLTLEPDTKLATLNPQMPDEELLTEMYAQSRPYLNNLGFNNYETSAFAKPSFECRHNLNYWQFGDFIGIGAGAHGKQSIDGKVIRYAKPKNPELYISTVNQKNSRQSETLSESEIILEFMINAMRLTNGWNKQLFTDRTQIKLSMIEEKIEQLVDSGLLLFAKDIIRPTAKGRMLLDEILKKFV